MFEWLGQKLAALWRAFVPFFVGFMLAIVVFQYIHLMDENDRTKERLPEVREYDAQQLPPGAVNLRGLGNRWILFEMEVNHEKKTFLFRRGYTRDQPDVLTQVK